VQVAHGDESKQPAKSFKSPTIRMRGLPGHTLKIGQNLLRRSAKDSMNSEKRHFADISFYPDSNKHDQSAARR
jgi:hypothetical protein